MNSKLEYAKYHYHHSWKPNILISLSNIQSVINDSQSRSSLTPTVQWLDVDPGRQYMTGSFHPTDHNFYRDAYAPSSNRRHKKILYSRLPSNNKRLYTVDWSYKRWRPYDSESSLGKEASAKVERAFRQYKLELKNNNYKSDGLKSTSITLPNNTKVDFSNMLVNWPDGYSRSRAVRTKTYIGITTKDES
jgi:hypothetical protein